jgi:adenine-specific DNA-methyltransferase
LPKSKSPGCGSSSKREWAKAQKTKKFGLVFDRHLPEFAPIPKAQPRRGDLVAKKGRSRAIASSPANILSA